MKPFWLLALILVFAAACSSAPSASPGIIPDPGSIWFGTSYDPGTFAVQGRATTFAEGAPLVVVARLNRRSTGETLGLAITDGVLDAIGRGQIPAGDDIVTHVLTPSDLSSTGTFRVAVEDSGGTHLADGTVTITP